MKKAREAMGLSTATMARLMGITIVSNYQRLESGRRQPTKQQKATVRALLLLHRHGLLDYLKGSSEHV